FPTRRCSTTPRNCGRAGSPRRRASWPSALAPARSGSTSTSTSSTRTSSPPPTTCSRPGSTGTSWRSCSARSSPPRAWSAPRSPVTTRTRTRASSTADASSPRSAPDRLSRPGSEDLVALDAEEESVAGLIHAGDPVLAADALRATDLGGGPVGERRGARVERRVARADEARLAVRRGLDPLTVADLARASGRARRRRPVAFADVAAGSPFIEVAADVAGGAAEGPQVDGPRRLFFFFGLLRLGSFLRGGRFTR